MKSLVIVDDIRICYALVADERLKGKVGHDRKKNNTIYACATRIYLVVLSGGADLVIVDQPTRMLV